MTQKHDIFNPRQVTSEPLTPSSIADAMLSAWETVIPKHAGLALTPERQTRLNYLHAKAFEARLLRWAEFVDLIASNEFLMEKVADGNIDWALENYEMILAGKYPGGSNDVAKTVGAETDAVPIDPAASASPIEPATLAINGEKEYSHGGMLARRISKPGSKS